MADGSPGAPREGVSSSAADLLRIRRLRRIDLLARVGITGGGLTIIFAVLGIFVFVFAEALPLLYPARVADGGQVVPPAAGRGRILAMGEDEYREAGWALTDAGRILLLDLRARRVSSEIPLEGLGGARILSGARALDHDFVAAGTSDGRVLAAGIEFEPVFAGGRRSGQTVRVAWQAIFPLRDDGGPVPLVAVSAPPERIAVAGAGPGFVAAASRKIEGTRVRRAAPPPGTLAEAEPTSLALDEPGESLCVGTAPGRIRTWRIDPEGESLDPVADHDAGGRPITALAWAFGSQSLLSGDAAGRVAGWQTIQGHGSGGRELRRMREFPPCRAAVAAFAPSRRNKSFLVVDRDGGMRLDHLTTERTLADLGSPAGGGVAVVAPKFDGATAVEADGSIRHLDLEAHHPEVSTGALFGPVLYEGYDRPEYVWQSTGGTDDFEPKFSLVPLVIGSLKGVLYALLFSVPFALAAAIYTSLFAPPALRGIVKPTVEVMAALPSVVIGFLAGLWLSPFVDKHLSLVAAAAVLAPISVVASVAMARFLPSRARARLEGGGGLLYAAGFLAAGFAAASLVAPVLERVLFDGDPRAWLRLTLGVTYDPRNSLVVGFALGFAVIPIIYTVSEDAMSNVPRSLRAASEALGASRWQTAWRLVVPAASPGIFAAVMLGFGRAVGETMIVVMATGNTPVLDFSPFNGMRTISACIAVEMPEAPVGGSLYRVLFLAGALLFLFAFLCNTAADVVGHRLRSRYAKW